MTWRTAIGLTPTQTDLAQDLLKAAQRHGLAGWRHDAAECAIRNCGHVINLANIHLEYAAASILPEADINVRHHACVFACRVHGLVGTVNQNLLPDELYAGPQGWKVSFPLEPPLKPAVLVKVAIEIHSKPPRRSVYQNPSRR
jgi:hypothetical protein